MTACLCLRLQYVSLTDTAGFPHALTSKGNLTVRRTVLYPARLPSVSHHCEQKAIVLL